LLQEANAVAHCLRFSCGIKNALIQEDHPFMTDYVCVLAIVCAFWYNKENETIEVFLWREMDLSMI
jgi:hypothetical protein